MSRRHAPKGGGFRSARGPPGAPGSRRPSLPARIPRSTPALITGTLSQPHFHRSDPFYGLSRRCHPLAGHPSPHGPPAALPAPPAGSSSISARSPPLPTPCAQPSTVPSPTPRPASGARTPGVCPAARPGARVRTPTAWLRTPAHKIARPAGPGPPPRGGGLSRWPQNCSAPATTARAKHPSARQGHRRTQGEVFRWGR
jgi:hypothetical protein